MIQQMRFTKIGGKWVSKDGEQGGFFSGNHVEDDGDNQVVVNAEDNGADEHQTSQGDQGNDVPGEAYGAGPSTRSIILP